LAAAARSDEKRSLQRIADALGGPRVLALECDVSAWTVRAWLRGVRSPSNVSQRRINVLASELGVAPPYPRWETGIRRRTLDP
jgi:hypothetical protein